MNSEPFRGSAAMQRGQVTRNDLRLRYRPIFRDVYLDRTAELTALAKAKAAWLSTGATLAGQSAAAVYGTKWLDARRPAEIVRADRHAQAGMRVHTYVLDADEVRSVRGMRVTAPARTAFDIGRELAPEHSVPILDALPALAERHRGSRGVRRLRSTMALVDGGAESPPESRLRLLICRAGLPKPETQIEFFDDYGEAVIRVDMGWGEWKVAVEYDGVQHWTDRRQRSWDIDLRAAGCPV